MRFYVSEILTRLQLFSEKLENTALLTNKKWVMIDSDYSNKIVYIFRKNNELLVSINGVVEKSKWEYIGHDCILIELNGKSYLFKQGFFNENILALQMDNHFGFLILANENLFNKKINSIDSVNTYINNSYSNYLPTKNQSNKVQKHISMVESNKGLLAIELNSKNSIPSINNRVLLEGKLPPNGKYKIGFLENLTIKNGVIVNISSF